MLKRCNRPVIYANTLYHDTLMVFTSVWFQILLTYVWKCKNILKPVGLTSNMSLPTSDSFCFMTSHWSIPVLSQFHTPRWWTMQQYVRYSTTYTYLPWHYFEPLDLNLTQVQTIIIYSSQAAVKDQNHCYFSSGSLSSKAWTRCFGQWVR